MALTAEQYQAEIASDVGQVGNNTLAAKVPVWWSMHSDYAYDVKLQYLYTLKWAIRWLVAQNWTAFDWVEADIQKKESQKVAMLLKLLGEVKEDIAAVAAGSTSGFTYGKLTSGGPSDPDVLAGKVHSYPYPNPDPTDNTICQPS